MVDQGVGKGGGLILTRSRPLRLLTMFLFYFTQGFPIGLFFNAVPAWMAANGATATATASVVGMAANLSAVALETLGRRLGPAAVAGDWAQVDQLVERVAVREKAFAALFPMATVASVPPSTEDTP